MTVAELEHRLDELITAFSKKHNVPTHDVDVLILAVLCLREDFVNERDTEVKK